KKTWYVCHNRDPTAYRYQFQDDPFLSPRTSSEFTLFSLSQESGRSAAKFFINNNPKLFTKDFAEPHIPCLMPETVSLLLEEVSEEALKERIHLRRVTAAVDMYDQLLQAGTAVSMETTHDLLDLIALYCDRNPAEDGGPQTESSESGEEAKKKKGRFRQASYFLNATWKENNNAERIFNLLSEKDTRCYAALIRGMVRHGAYARAFSLYTDMLNNRITGDIHIFNALISAASEVREQYNERWDLITELLKQMNQQKIQPTLQTFNSVLKALRRCGFLAKTQALHTLSEMKALGIGSSGPGNVDILQEIMSEISGMSFTCQDPDDDNKDLELGYKVHALVEVGENRRLVGDPYQQSIYYGRFFNLLCMMEHADVVLKWYKRLIPSLYYPNTQGLKDLLQTLDTESRLDLIPTIWKDIRSLGHENKSGLVEEVLSLMARDKHSPEVQELFAQCALDIKTVYTGEGGWSRLEWTPAALSYIASLLLRTDKTQQAWEILQLFKTNNRVPSAELLEDFLLACHSSGSSQRAVELVQMSAAFCLSTTPKLAEKVLAQFDMSSSSVNQSTLSQTQGPSENKTLKMIKYEHERYHNTEYII
uniref:Small ribosomal subunit protein mS39 n=1 Tax=Sphaeramia orbicularis TaxID=375764 RepID=A0A673CKH1_9TELE